MIFSPNWIAKNLFDGANVTIELPVGNPQAPPRFTVDTVRLLVTAQRVVVIPTLESEAALGRMESTAIKILELLPHTPLSAAGINFHYEDPDPPHDLLALFRFPDAARIDDLGFTTDAWSLTRTLTKDDFRVNFSTALDAGSANLDFNFHREVNDPLVAAAYLKGRVLACLGVARAILGQYDLVGGVPD